MKKRNRGENDIENGDENENENEKITNVKQKQK
jgi:hypothetical protein